MTYTSQVSRPRPQCFQALLQSRLNISSSITLFIHFMQNVSPCHIMLSES